MTRKNLYRQIPLVLALALFAGCSKNNKPAPETPTANTPAATQPAGDQQPTTNVPPANTAAPASGPTAQQPAQTTQAQASQPQAPAPAPPALPAVPAGTVLRVRMGQTINVKHASSGGPFSGTVVDPIVVDGNTVIPAGSTAEGVIVRAHKRGHFKGASVLQLTLTGLNVNGQHYRIETSSITRTKKGKGKRTAAFIGGGSGLGMLIGGVATGGVGLVVGGLAGAGAGTGVAAFTGNKDITIPAESVVSFRLANSIQLR
jgi:glucose/arabinose dehydrogenase